MSYTVPRLTATISSSRMSRSAGAATVRTAHRLRPFGRHHAVHGWSAEPAPPRFAFLLRGIIRGGGAVVVVAVGLPACTGWPATRVLGPGGSNHSDVRAT